MPDQLPDSVSHLIDKSVDDLELQMLCKKSLAQTCAEEVPKEFEERVSKVTRKSLVRSKWLTFILPALALVLVLTFSVYFMVAIIRYQKVVNLVDLRGASSFSKIEKVFSAHKRYSSEERRFLFGDESDIYSSSRFYGLWARDPDDVENLYTYIRGCYEYSEITEEAYLKARELDSNNSFAVYSTAALLSEEGVVYDAAVGRRKDSIKPPFKIGDRKKYERALDMLFLAESLPNYQPYYRERHLKIKQLLAKSSGIKGRFEDAADLVESDVFAGGLGMYRLARLIEYRAYEAYLEKDVATLDRLSIAAENLGERLEMHQYVLMDVLAFRLYISSVSKIFAKYYKELNSEKAASYQARFEGVRKRRFHEYYRHNEDEKAEFLKRANPLFALGSGLLLDAVEEPVSVDLLKPSRVSYWALGDQFAALVFAIVLLLLVGSASMLFFIFSPVMQRMWSPHNKS